MAPHLPPEVLHRLIRHAGLERCVEMVNALSRDQLTAVFDLDLWRATLPGADEEFGLLAQLSAEDAECFHALMAGCRHLSDAGRELDGLDDLLEASDQLLHDVRVDREDRRQARGFSIAADARAFLAIARQPGPRIRSNAIAEAWFRRADDGEVAGRPVGSPSAPHVAELPEASAPLDPILTDSAGEAARAQTAELLLPEPLRALLGAGPVGDGGPSGLRPLMDYLSGRHPDIWLTRGQELAFLANTLVSGCRLPSRAFTPSEASQAVVATCSLGLAQRSTPPLDYLVRHDLVALFGEGWATLHREVSVFVAEGLLAILRGARRLESDTREGLRALEQSLETHLAAGTPWLAQEDLEVLAVLDTPAWYGLCGLLSECPVIPEAVTAILERRTGRIDPKAFAFIATTADLDAVRAFMACVPELLVEAGTPRRGARKPVPIL